MDIDNSEIGVSLLDDLVSEERALHPECTESECFDSILIDGIRVDCMTGMLSREEADIRLAYFGLSLAELDV